MQNNLEGNPTINYNNNAPNSKGANRINNNIGNGNSNAKKNSNGNKKTIM